jgi:hypothetical protein
MTTANAPRTKGKLEVGAIIGIGNEFDVANGKRKLIMP